MYVPSSSFLISSLYLSNYFKILVSLLLIYMMQVRLVPHSKAPVSINTDPIRDESGSFLENEDLISFTSSFSSFSFSSYSSLVLFLIFFFFIN